MVDSAYNIEEAVLAAIEFFDGIYKNQELHEVMLEEVRDKDDDTWEVTLGFSRPAQKQSALGAISPGGPILERVYKTLAVNKHTGKVGSMTIRTV